MYRAAVIATKGRSPSMPATLVQDAPMGSTGEKRMLILNARRVQLDIGLRKQVTLNACSVIAEPITISPSLIAAILAQIIIIRKTKLALYAKTVPLDSKASLTNRSVKAATAHTGNINMGPPVSFVPLVKCLSSVTHLHA